MSSDDIAIKIHNVSKHFMLPHQKASTLKSFFLNPFTKYEKEKQMALDDVSLEIKKGEFFGIVGRNGSGKSTLLKCMAGVYSPDNGRIKINGRLVPFIELGVGFNPELSGRDNVYLNGSLLGFSRHDIDQMYGEIVKFAELEEFMDQKLKNYSSGMQVRLAFSIAIQAKGDVLILDEVLAVGDANFQKKCFDYFYELKENHKTVILVSHSMDSVRKFCDRAALIDKGKIIMIDDAQKVGDLYTQKNISNPARKGIDLEREEPKHIKKVTVLCAQYNGSSAVTSEDELKIIVDYNLGDLRGEFNIGLGLYDSDRSYIFGYNTQMDKFKIKKQAGSLELQFKKLPLLRGEYSLNVVCFGREETAPYEFRPNAASFFVKATSKNKLYRGLLSLEHSWHEQ